MKFESKQNNANQNSLKDAITTTAIITTIVLIALSAAAITIKIAKWKNKRLQRRQQNSSCRYANQQDKGQWCSAECKNKTTKCRIHKKRTITSSIIGCSYLCMQQHIAKRVQAITTKLKTTTILAVVPIHHNLCFIIAHITFASLQWAATDWRSTYQPRPLQHSALSSCATCRPLTGCCCTRGLLLYIAYAFCEMKFENQNSKILISLTARLDLWRCVAFE